MLRLYVDGAQVAVSTAFNSRDYDLSNNQPLKIGFGVNDYFDGLLSDLRIYHRPLEDSELTDLAMR